MRLEQHGGSRMKSLTVVHATIASSLAYCSVLGLGWKLLLYPVPRQGRLTWLPNICVLCPAVLSHSSPPGTRGRADSCRVCYGVGSWLRALPRVLIPCIIDRDWNGFCISFPQLSLVEDSYWQEGERLSREEHFLHYNNNPIRCFIQVLHSPKPFHFNDVLKQKAAFMASEGEMERTRTGRIRGRGCQSHCFLTNWRVRGINQSSQNTVCIKNVLEKSDFSATELTDPGCVRLCHLAELWLPMQTGLKLFPLVWLGFWCPCLFPALWLDRMNLVPLRHLPLHQIQLVNRFESYPEWTDGLTTENILAYDSFPLEIRLKTNKLKTWVMIQCITCLRRPGFEMCRSLSWSSNKITAL